MENNQFVSEVVAILKEQYRHVCEVYNTTKELRDCINSDERTLVKDALKARGIAMEKVSDCRMSIERLARKYHSIDVANFMLLVKGDYEKSGYRQEESFKPIKEQVDLSKIIWSKTVEMDKALSNRLIGKDSYYN